MEAGAGSTKPGALPSGAVQSNTDFGKPGYGGPCPPPGKKPHRYIFTLFALDVDKLDVPTAATAAFVGFNLLGHTLAKATLTGTYRR